MVKKVKMAMVGDCIVVEGHAKLTILREELSAAGTGSALPPCPNKQSPVLLRYAAGSAGFLPTKRAPTYF